jgi:hypothetical protein
LSDVHDVFHVSQLKKCLRVPEEQIPMEHLDANEDLFYQQYPHHDFGDVRKSYSKQGAMEPSYRGTSYLGKRIRVEGRVSNFIF